MFAALLAATVVASAPADIATIDALCLYTFKGKEESLPCTILAGHKDDLFSIGFSEPKIGLIAFFGDASNGGISVTHFAMTDVPAFRLPKPGRCVISAASSFVNCSAELGKEGTLEIFALVNK